MQEMEPVIDESLRGVSHEGPVVRVFCPLADHLFTAGVSSQLWRTTLFH